MLNLHFPAAEVARVAIWGFIHCNGSSLPRLQEQGREVGHSSAAQNGQHFTHMHFGLILNKVFAFSPLPEQQ